MNRNDFASKKIIEKTEPVSKKSSPIIHHLNMNDVIQMDGRLFYIQNWSIDNNFGNYGMHSELRLRIEAVGVYSLVNKFDMI